MTRSLSNRLFAIKKLPIRYLVIPKCGCTFIKNVLWAIEYGKPHANPLRIHDDDDKFLRASDFRLNTDELRRESFAFTVIRNPVDRFFSLYTDKVVGEGHANFVPLRKILSEKYALNTTPMTVDQHKKNCDILISWLDKNLATEVDIKKNPHWTPQSYRTDVFKEFELKMLTLSDLSNQLEFFLGGIVENIDELIKQAEPNRSEKQFPKQDILEQQLRKRINNVYSNDRKLYNEVRKAWSHVDMLTAQSSAVPRYDHKWAPKLR